MPLRRRRQSVAIASAARAAALAAFVLATALCAGARANPLRGEAIWTARPPATLAPATLAAELSAAGMHGVFIKAAEGATPEPGFTPALVEGLRSQGIGVCAWVFVYGEDPAGEAAAALAAARAGARCLVVDAEGQYDKRYGAAQAYVHALRSQLGAGFPIALAGQAEVLEHPKFPYSVFLAPGGFTYDMPQVYWRELRLSPSAALALAIAQNGWYGRPIEPVGQLFDAVSAAEVGRFVARASIDGTRGLSLFDLEALPPATIAAAIAVPTPSVLRPIAPATLRPGADGDEVLWAQEHLNGAGARLPVGGFYGAQTSRAVARFQRRHRLRPSGVLDARTWRALLRVPPRVPSWAAAPPLSAR